MVEEENQMNFKENVRWCDFLFVSGLGRFYRWWCLFSDNVLQKNLEAVSVLKKKQFFYGVDGCACAWAVGGEFVALSLCLIFISMKPTTLFENETWYFTPSMTFYNIVTMTTRISIEPTEFSIFYFFLFSIVRRSISFILSRC